MALSDIRNIAPYDQHGTAPKTNQRARHAVAKIAATLRQSARHWRIQAIVKDGIVRRQAQPGPPAASGAETSGHRLQGDAIKPQCLNRPDIRGEAGFDTPQLRSASEDHNVLHR